MFPPCSTPLAWGGAGVSCARCRSWLGGWLAAGGWFVINNHALARVKTWAGMLGGGDERTDSVPRAGHADRFSWRHRRAYASPPGVHRGRRHLQLVPVGSRFDNDHLYTHRCDAVLHRACRRLFIDDIGGRCRRGCFRSSRPGWRAGRTHRRNPLSSSRENHSTSSLANVVLMARACRAPAAGAAPLCTAGQLR